MIDVESIPLRQDSLRAPPEGSTRASDRPPGRVQTMVLAHFDVVWRTLRRLGVPSDTLDDAVQQVFIVAARKVETIQEGNEKPYLLGVAVRIASEARRARSRRRDVPDETALEASSDPRPAPDDLVDQKRARQVLDDVLASLPLDLRAAFTMFEIEEMSVPEVASALGVPLGTAASRLRRARELFRLRLDERGLGGGS